ncbi:unnamed protein product [Diatraea saccharalis]|uniref:EGF-like domain-containing protein n=1 Tax=Diatraea saccharalis TaxID=40085 RepID=A0A9P0C228_9NEOP|nr:unnamed protein product [Diatraea saccharalis]
MGYRRRRRRDYDSSTGPCAPGCEHGGRCVVLSGSGVGACACAGPWGGPHCQQYVGHDHACLEAMCAPPALCVWKPALNPLEPGTPYCVCPMGVACAGVEGAGGGGGGGGLAGALLALFALLAAVLAALYLLHRRRHGAFIHARLSDNVEINNPMYLADDEPEPRPHSNGGNHFANPVYESMYAPPQNNPEEQANLLADGDGSPPPPEHGALL